MSSTPLLPRAAGMSSPFLWRTGALITATAIAFGAFGAHGLKKRQGITAESIAAWNTAAHYAVFNGLGLLLISMHPRFSVHRFAGPAIMTGTILFSGSIFALTLNRDLKFLGPVTPLGGLAMIAGYLSLAL
ncbi:DUF423-domain-containing protein [Gymnopus androsaceus JB14]|uniref:DUF423-domain-containing protein n=1 Tax=Gymnopus androsaceus JB14 TaxID=1447944 RepID=A0A6A4ITB0_9AGAR|nr:DUF423-domain-containing protein [Gymnopus androsaceus JB14]